MLEIKLFRNLVCDNGKTYTIFEGNEFYDYRLREGSWLKEVNMVNKSYLEDAIKYDQTICVGRLENGNPVNVKITSVDKGDAEKYNDEMSVIIKGYENLLRVNQPK